LQEFVRKLPSLDPANQTLSSVNNSATQLAQNVNGAKDQLKNELANEDAMAGRYDDLVKQINDLPTSSELAPEQLVELQNQVLPALRNEALNLIESTAQAAKQRQFVSLIK
jgi:hypothetical protein